MSVSFDRVAEIFDETRGMPPKAMENAVKTLVKELNGYKRILDAGVGTGRYAKPLQDSGFEVVGIDIARKMLGKAVDKGVYNLFLSDACNLPFRDSSFDAAISFSVLHLISEWKTALREITRVTSDVLISMVRRHRNPIREAYNESMKRQGHEIRKVGIGEIELIEFVEPRKTIQAACYNVHADKTLEFIEDKAYSHQWNVPDSLHKQAMSEIRDKFVGKVYAQATDILMWDVKDLKAYLRASHRTLV